MRILCIHGVGNGDKNIAWREEWTRAVTQGLRQWGDRRPLEFHFTAYDDLFEAAPLDTGTVIEALVRLSASGLFHGFLDLFRSRGGMRDTLKAVRWTAGMVAQWVAHETLRADTRDRVARDIREVKPDLILAHSLGSLILYDTLLRDDVAGGALGNDRVVVTFGSQIGNPAVRQVFAGRIPELHQVRQWWHLYNEHDDVFTCPVEPSTRERFEEVETPFDIEGFADHEGSLYLGHEQTGLTVWHALASRTRGRAPAKQVAKAARKAKAPATPDTGRFRALLVGIADYPDPEHVLAGPVNDVYLVSQMLQQLGFPADSIRVAIDERATCRAIRERLCWLLLDAKPGDVLFFFFAGHGAQMPSYGVDSEVDRVDECLVPYDFDWNKGDAITDNEFAGLYSQLPYDASFFAVLDCCHSGGMTRGRSGGIRGLTPPDDIRHRSIRWDTARQMWLPRRKIAPDQPSQRVRERSDEKKVLWVGSSGAKRRLGRGSPLWMDDAGQYKRTRTAYGHKGPFTPVVFEACSEDQFAYEYQHGNVSYGAFTYAMCTELAKATYPKRKRLSFRELLANVRDQVPEVATGPQTPQMLCPDERWDECLPGLDTRGARK